MVKRNSKRLHWCALVVSLTCALSAHALPSLGLNSNSDDPRAALRRADANPDESFCRGAFRNCLLQSTSQQANCLGKIATAAMCRTHPIAATLKRRAALETEANSNRALQRCLEPIDAGFSSWLLSAATQANGDTGRGDAETSDVANEFTDFLVSTEAGLATCETLSPMHQPK